MFDEFQLGLYEGMMNERERIIALLSTHFIDDEGFQDDGLVSLEYTIALIKGENK